jgi:hypothetical protein
MAMQSQVIKRSEGGKLDFVTNNFSFPSPIDQSMQTLEGKP